MRDKVPISQVGGLVDRNAGIDEEGRDGQVVGIVDAEHMGVRVPSVFF